MWAAWVRFDAGVPVKQSAASVGEPVKGGSNWALRCADSVPLPRSLRFPVLCKAQLQNWLEFTLPSLQGGVGDFPPWLRPLHERGHDVTFLGCARPVSVSVRGRLKPSTLSSSRGVRRG